MVFLYLPIAFMIIFSFDESQTPGLPITGFTLHWYEVMLDNRVAPAGASGTPSPSPWSWRSWRRIIGTMAAFVLVRGRDSLPERHPDRVHAADHGAGRPDRRVAADLLRPGRRTCRYRSGPSIAGQLVVTVPFVVLIVASRLQGFDRALEWAAADLGASPRQAIRHIVLPLISPAILAGALISVTLSIDEFVITWFTVGAQPTLPTYIYTQIKFGVTPEVNAVATIMLVATLLIFAIASLVAGAGSPSPRPAPQSGGRLMRAAVFDGPGRRPPRGRPGADGSRRTTTSSSRSRRAASAARTSRS